MVTPLRLMIHGRVHGVGFRDSMRDQAVLVGITGWVRNRADGTVEAVIEGKRQALEKLIAWARHGPAAARVTRVEVEDWSGKFTAFEIRSTA